MAFNESINTLLMAIITRIANWSVRRNSGWFGGSRECGDGGGVAAVDGGDDAVVHLEATTVLCANQNA